MLSTAEKTDCRVNGDYGPELSMGWVDPRVRRVKLVGSGWVQDFAFFDGFGWVGSNMTKVLYFFDDYTTYNCIPVGLLRISRKVHMIKVESMNLIRLDMPMRAGMLSQ